MIIPVTKNLVDKDDFSKEDELREEINLDA